MCKATPKTLIETEAQVLSFIETIRAVSNQRRPVLKSLAKLSNNST